LSHRVYLTAERQNSHRVTLRNVVHHGYLSLHT